MRKKMSPEYEAKLIKGERILEGRIHTTMDLWGDQTIGQLSKRSLRMMCICLLDECRQNHSLWAGCPEDKADLNAYYMYVSDCIRAKAVFVPWESVPLHMRDGYRALAKEGTGGE